MPCYIIISLNRVNTHLLLLSQIDNDFYFSVITEIIKIIIRLIILALRRVREAGDTKKVEGRRGGSGRAA